MQANYPKQNPFERANPVRLPNKIYEPRAPARPPLDYSALMYRPTTEHYHINMWNFKDDNSSKFNPYQVKSHHEGLTEFEKSLRISRQTTFREAGRSRKAQSFVQDNPFYRKNLLISREQVEEEINHDLNKINYSYWLKDNSYPSSRYRDTPDNSEHKISLENNSFMPSGGERDSMGAKRPSDSQGKPRSSEKKGRDSLKKGLDVGVEAVAQKGKEEVTVRGKKFFLSKVYPRG